MQEAFVHMEKCLALFEEMDPNAQCFSKVMGACHEALAPYSLILEDKKSKHIQGTLDKFLRCVQTKRASKETSDSQLSTSTM